MYIHKQIHMYVCEYIYVYACVHAWSFCHVRFCSPVDCRPPDFSDVFRQEYCSGCHFLHQRIVLTQGLNSHLLCLLHWQADSLPLSHVGNSYICVYIHVVFSLWYSALHSSFSSSHGCFHITGCFLKCCSNLFSGGKCTWKAYREKKNV